MVMVVQTDNLVWTLGTAGYQSCKENGMSTFCKTIYITKSVSQRLRGMIINRGGESISCTGDDG